MLDIDGITEKVRWNFFDAWPTKWDGPDFNAKGNDVAIETLELAHRAAREGVAVIQTEHSSSRCRSATRTTTARCTARA